MTTNPRSMHFLQTQALQQLTHAPQTFTKKDPKLSKNVPTARNIAKKTQIHDDQPTTPAF